MNGQLLDFIGTVKSNADQFKRYDEIETKQAMILPVLQFLGWNVWDTEEVKPEHPVEGKKAAEGGKVDYCLRIQKNSKVFIEVKRPSEDLEKHQEQLLVYSFTEGVNIAVLSNGIVWWFFLPLKKGHWKERKFYAIDISQQGSDEIAEIFNQLIAKQNVQSGEALKNAEFILEERDRKKKITETLPKAWNKLIGEYDATLINLLAETTESMCGFKPEDEDTKKMILRYKNMLMLPEATIGIFPPPPPPPPQQLQQQFFEGLINKTNTKTNLFSKAKINTVNSFIFVGTGQPTALGFIVLKDKGKIELSIHDNKANFDALYSQKDEIEKEIGSPLDWGRADGKVYSWIRKWFNDGGLNYLETWPQLQEKMADAMVKFGKAFLPRLKELGIERKNEICWY
jgi:predicted type IV restriction endonuclease